ncbi:CheR family methyltransferase [Methylocapsa palsarum]|uniref:Two-component system, chemotaxis family, CheB/CheR fusion protein n=1 Tax=Methylocapsa palsarum TaxID=1612308 RepID=A0A1I4CVP5_9HYPH|nr:CheR family methyltransferase [Methylocapsa palsarum]SFK84873.1 two-component system, chemotaxis family, CheB/CheR fusion protein [Methylocapsa palsarum]
MSDDPRNETKSQSKEGSGWNPETQSRTGRPVVRVVGIGASAGGLDAFRGLFEHMPSNSGLAFVVILHLPVGRKSMLAEILGRWTKMPVTEAAHNVRLEANIVYVPPPHAIVTLRDGRLHIRMPDPDAPRQYRPIDVFFDSLASALRENAVGVVLSGTGSDGALGLKAIRLFGGLTIAQGVDGTGPQYSEMPEGAIAAGVVDLVAPVEDIPAHILRLAGLPSPDAAPAGVPVEEDHDGRLKLCEVLHKQVGHDFSGYREKTFMRRVQRRMNLTGVKVFRDYIALVEADRGEALLLLRDLLIRVTSFFRDNEAFTVLKNLVMPRLFAGKGPANSVRIWVPGCATGEEAYSLAMLVCEHMDGIEAPPKVQILATDIDEPAIVSARLGRYPESLLQGLSVERKARFFNKVETGYAVSREIRDLCMFSSHSIVRDPPFSRMDMISCRNLLIYMDIDLQSDVIPAFHYSLVPGGILMLGISESTSRHDDLFEPLDKAARIFVRKTVESPRFAFPDPREAASPFRPYTGTRAHRPVEHDGGQRSADAPEPSVFITSTRRLPMGNFFEMIGAARRKLSEYLSSSETAQLRENLTGAQEQLQVLREERETALEELRSANEELRSVNEEFQSTNEELETSKEELQSVNEELHTVNARLTEKVDELDQTNSDLRNLLDSTQIATIFLDRHLIIRSFTPAVSAIYRLIPSDQGRPLSDIVGHIRHSGLADDVNQVLASLQPLERRVTRDDGQAHYLMRILPYRSPDSTVSGVVVTFLDVTTIVEAELHHQLLIEELNHRVRNMLTVVIALATQTLRRVGTLEEFSTTFLGRVHALAASYTLLSAENWSSISLRDLIVEETKPYALQDRANITIDGAEIRLTPAGGLALGMAVHELATNAVKYGALSVPEGIVSISWRVEGEAAKQSLVLNWNERGGPPVAPPSQRGFGTTIIKRGLAHELDGVANIDFRAEGVAAALTIPMGVDVFVKPSC